MRYPLSGQVALVTGSSRGIGRFIADELAAAGADVVIAARTEVESDPKLPGTIYSAAEEVASASGVRTLAVRMDMTDDAQVQAGIERAITELGRLDILVNNAGIMAPAPFLQTPVKRWDLIWRVNVRGAIVAIQAALPHMLERGSGTIINISSRGADMPGAGNNSYSVSKLALRKIAEGLAEEHKESGVRFFSLSPDKLVLSPGATYHRLATDYPPEMIEPNGHMGRACVWLASDPRAAERNGGHFYSSVLLREV
jgi:citronellol/citronellal dehydrogenase